MTTPTDPLYASQWHFGLIGDIETIWDEYNGAGVHVGVYDEGVDYNHEDLAANYDASRHVVDDLGNPVDPFPITGDDGHGTACAGIIGAANNGVGGVGVAWGVGLTAVNIDFANTGLYGSVNAPDPSGFLDVVGQAAGLFDIMSNSWGTLPAYAGFNSLTNGSLRDLTDQVYNTLCATGRSGLGTIIAQAAGNDNRDANGDGLNASRFTITVAATEYTGFAAAYSNFGTSILVAAPAAAVTTDMTGADGYSPDNYTTTFNGTSAATPVVSGVVALMLQANSGLGWRDVQNILANSATLTGSSFDAITDSSTEDGLWQSNHSGNWNGGGNHINFNYGYGMVNAYNAVRMAEVWNLFAPAQTSANEQTSFNQNTSVYTLADNNANGNTTTFTVTDTLSIDHLALHLDVASTNMREIAITLTSAEGTVITVNLGGGTPVPWNGINYLVSYTGDYIWGVDNLRGELTAGTWTLRVADTVAGGTTTVRSAALEFFGSAASVDDVYHFTSEYLAMVGFQAGRATITDTNGGTDWLNMAAVAGAVSIDMQSGQTFTVDGVAWGTLSGDFENIVTSDGNDTIYGNDLDNTIHGMRGNDELYGGLNAVFGGPGDVMYGGTGNDTMNGGENKDVSYGGTGNDVFKVTGNNFGDDVYGGADNDTLDLTDPSASDAFVVNLSLSNYHYVNNPYGALGDFVLFDVENVIGSRLADDITGNFLANVLSGGAGADKVNGGGSNDTLSGDVGADILNGGTGVDSMAGGTENDWYYVDNAADIIVEITGGGADDRVYTSVSFALAADDDIETLGTTAPGGITAINLTGNGVAQTLFGNAGVNQLAGGGNNDTLNGGAGADTLNGGTGVDSMIGGTDNDWYYVDNAADIIVENAGGGSDDRVYTSVSFALAIDDDIETLGTAAPGGTTAINLTGNGLAQTLFGNAGINALNGGANNDTLNGGAGSDTLNGGTGVDSLVGGTDNDVYYLDSAADIIVEGVGGGTLDRAFTSVSFTLAADDNIEFLGTTSPTGVAAINLTGNAQSQTLVGNNGANQLRGGLGNDTLTGGAGVDQFVFNTALGATNVDKITDYTLVDDVIVLNHLIFTALGVGPLAAAAFTANLTGVATGVADRIIYESDTGNLFYDRDGLNGVAGVLFATITAGLAGMVPGLGHSEFTIV